MLNRMRAEICFCNRDDMNVAASELIELDFAVRELDWIDDESSAVWIVADALTAHERQPARTVAALVRANERLREQFPLIVLPLLMVHGTADKAAAFPGSQFLYHAAGSTDKTLKLYAGHYHDLLSDVGREEVVADMLRWIVDRLPPWEVLS